MVVWVDNYTTNSNPTKFPTTPASHQARFRDVDRYLAVVAEGAGVAEGNRDARLGRGALHPVDLAVLVGNAAAPPLVARLVSVVHPRLLGSRSRRR